MRDLFADFMRRERHRKHVEALRARNATLEAELKSRSALDSEFNQLLAEGMKHVAALRAAGVLSKDEERERAP